MLAMIFGELANFAAYAFAPAILVTPLGALSILVSAVLAHTLLKERLNVFGVVGCVLCCAGAFVIVLNAPDEQPLINIKQASEQGAGWQGSGRQPRCKAHDCSALSHSLCAQVAELALRPAFLAYAFAAIAAVLYLVFVVAPECGTSNLLVYIAICSAMGSLSVMSCKGLGIAVKLTLEGSNQFLFPETYFCILVRRTQTSPCVLFAAAHQTQSPGACPA